MATYLVSYDLRATGRDYAGLYKAIASNCAAWWHHLDSTWVVITDKPVAILRDSLTGHIDSNDKLVVFELGHAAAWKGIDAKGSEWLKANL